MNDLAVYLAAEAHRLGLELNDLQGAAPDAVQAFARSVLNELAALGLMQGGKEVGCWAVPRSDKH